MKGKCLTENFIVILIIVFLAVIGIIYTVKHFKRQGGCCGGGDYKIKKKKLSKVIYKKTFKVDGMKCTHCKNRVEEAINDIKGVAARVNLKEGLLTVLYSEDIDDSVIKSKVEKAGYKIN